MKLLLRLLILYRPYWGWLLLGCGLGLITLLANVALMGVSGWFITAMGLAGVAGTSLDYFSPAALIRAFAIVRTGGRYGERLVTHEATFRLIASLRVWLYRRIEPQPITALETYHSGDLNSRMRSDIDRLETAYLRVFAPLTVAIVACALILIWLSRYAPSFALAEGLLLALSGFAVPMLLTRSAVLGSRRQARLQVRLSEAAVDGLQGMPELLAFGAAQRHRERFSTLSQEMIGEQVRMGRRDGLAQSAMLLGSNLALWGIVVLAIPLVRRGDLAPADLVMTALVGLAAFEAIAPLPSAFLAMGGVLQSAKRVFALADACPSELIPSPPAGEAAPERCDLRLSGLTYAYTKDSPPIVNGMNLDLPQGRKIALVGPTGVGKSTLVMLLTGLLLPDGGRILLNGHPVDSRNPEALRRCFSVAPQNPGLFSGTVRDNLLLAKPDAEDAELWAVLSVACLADFVASLPDQLGCWLGEAGQTLSGGQARRLSITRALLREAPVLILDEPGEGLDYGTERQMLGNVVAHLKGRSVLLITHRTAGLDLMDAVVPLAPAFD
jgi:ATP-binding cassette, subfamily C, bacterial CydC